VWLENLRLLLVYAVMNSFITHSMDINNAFLQANLHEEVYVTQPEGFVDADHPRCVLRLKCALYRLKQAPLMWNQTLDAFLTEIGFSAASTDPCLYTLHNHSAMTEGDQSMYNPELHTIFINSDATSTPQVILSVYVDDLLIIRLPSNVETVKEQLQKRFCIKDFGPVTTILGINVNTTPLRACSTSPRSRKSSTWPASSTSFTTSPSGACFQQAHTYVSSSAPHQHMLLSSFAS